MSMTHLLVMLAVAWLATTGAVFGLGWSARGYLAGRQLEQAAVQWKAARTSLVADQPVPYRPTRAGWLDYVPYGPAPAGAADPVYELDRMAVLDDAITLVENQMTWRQAADEVSVIVADVEAHPERWRS